MNGSDQEVLSYWHRRNLEDPPRGTLWPDHLGGEEKDEYWQATIRDYVLDQSPKGKEYANVFSVIICTFDLTDEEFGF